MSDVPAEGEEEDWLDDLLIGDDPTGERYWRRNALGGMSKTDALSGIPTRGQLNLTVPMHVWREIKAHCQAHGIGVSVWLRQAVGARMMMDGYENREILQYLLAGNHRDDD